MFWRSSAWLLHIMSCDLSTDASTVCAGDSDIDHRAALQSLATTLAAVDTFYDSIGGLLGYQLKCLQILQSEACSLPDNNR